MTKPSIFYINKTKVVLFPIKNVRSIEINITIKCGSWYEIGERWGIFHFLEHMILQGTKNLPSSEKISEFAKENGIYYNAFTNGTKINIPLNIPDLSLNQGLKMLEEIVFNPLISKEKIKNELGAINQEFLSKWDRPETRFFRKIDKHIFGKNHIYIRDGLGQIDFIKNISSSDLKKIHQQYFQPQNMIITIVGNIKNKPELIKKLTKIFNKHPNTFKSKIKYPLITPSSQQTLIYQDKPNQENITLIWILEKNKKNNRLKKISNIIFNNLFGNSIDSLLFKIFRLKYGLVYGIKSSISNYKNCSFFEISCQIDPTNRQKFLEIFKKELKNIFSQINEKMFKRTIKYLNYQELIVYDSVKEISNLITNESFLYKKIFLPEDYIDLSKKINFKKTLLYFKEKITWENKYLFIMTSANSNPNP
ncbi:MAG: pitrilysin family protein [Candidatus Shapirobacteria bacterium]|nr:pitrilysin family protein [Candidatus Shapirobacteria bacterium]